MTTTIIQAQSITQNFPMGNQLFCALKDINCTIKSQDFIGIVGPSGSGKTTLLNLFGLLMKPSAGTLELFGKNIDLLSEKESAKIRAQSIGFIFQMYYLFQTYNVYENVQYPLLILDIPKAERHDMVIEALDIVALTDKKNSQPKNLSGGQCQRVAIARAIVKKPTLILADEPTANLDRENSHRILQTMQNINEKLGTTFVFSTHDEKVIQYLKSQITIDNGEIVSSEKAQ